MANFKSEFTKLYGGTVTVEKREYDSGAKAYYVTDEKLKIENKKMAGVTTFLGIKDKSAALVQWATQLTARNLIAKNKGEYKITDNDIIEASNAHKIKLAEASDTGTNIHSWCEQYINFALGISHEKPNLPENTSVLLAATQFIEWVEKNKVKFVSTEQVVYSRKHQYIGTADIVAEVNGKLALVDIKSSSGLYNSVLCQTAAYAQAIEEENKKIKFKTRIAIRLPKMTKEEHMEEEEKKCYVSGKNVNTIKEYVPFESMEFSGRETMKRDFRAFIAHKEVYEWNQATDFYLNK